MKRGGEPFEHVFLCQIPQSRMLSFKTVEIFKYRFGSLLLGYTEYRLFLKSPQIPWSYSVSATEIRLIIPQSQVA
jgi:hypothetical protein